MRYQQNEEQSAELLRLIVPRIAAHGGHFTPWAYSVWYEHLAGINPPMSEALEACLRLKTANVGREIENLYASHIQAGEVRSLARLQAGLGELLRKLSDIASQSSIGAKQYYEALVHHEADLTGVIDADTLRAVLEALKASTISVRVQTSMLHTQIEAGREHMLALHEQLDTLRGEALTDPLTGLNNRRGFEQACERLFSDRDGARKGAALVMLDIDHFKQVNDTFGHLVGDQALRVAAHIISASVKGRDVAVRFGGDEFLILLPETGIQGALAVAEQIREGLSRARVRHTGGAVPQERVTISAGVAVMTPVETVEQALHRADKALYRAKEGGRNRVCVAQPGID